MAEGNEDWTRKEKGPAETLAPLVSFVVGPLPDTQSPILANNLTQFLIELFLSCNASKTVSKCFADLNYSLWPSR
jgi:hypothetical protein